MKRIAAIAMAAGLLLTGCAQDSENYAELKASCIEQTYPSVKDGVNPVIKTYVQLDNMCHEFAKDYEGLTPDEAIEIEHRNSSK